MSRINTDPRADEGDVIGDEENFFVVCPIGGGGPILFVKTAGMSREAIRAYRAAALEFPEFGDVTSLPELRVDYTSEEQYLASAGRRVEWTILDGLS